MELRVLSPTGALGATPLDEDSFRRGMARKPHVIGADAGSNDVGPFGLGANACYFPREWVKHDLRLMLVAAREHGIPMVIGSAGHMGTDWGVDYYVEIIEEIAREEKLAPFRLAKIYTELDRETLLKAVRNGDFATLDGSQPLTEEDIEATSHAVAVIGAEPFVEAFRQGAEVIIAGRACDDAIFSSYPIYKGFDKALSVHLGKVLECASVAGTPYMARNSMLGTIREDSILFEPMNPRQICTPVSVAAHSMYEEAHPHYHRIPGGVLHLAGCQFTQVDPRTVQVTGTRLEETELRLKVEGAGWVGHRFVGLVGVRDPLTIQNMDHVLNFARQRVEKAHPDLKWGEDYQIHTHVYGLNAIMGAREPMGHNVPHEVCIVVEGVAKDKELARRVTRMYRKSLMVAEYPGQKATTGKAAILADEELTGMDGYRWTIYHTMRVSSPLDHSRIELITVGGGGAQ